MGWETEFSFGQRETDIQQAVGHRNLGGEVGKEAQYRIFASFFGVNTSSWLISSYQHEVTIIEYRVGKK